jgi:hypothetical protein
VNHSDIMQRRLFLAMLGPTGFLLSRRNSKGQQYESRVATSAPTVSIDQVVGLANELAIRPVMGIAYTPGRAAIIDSAGNLEGATGDAGDVVGVDGNRVLVGSATTETVAYVDNVVPTGNINGTNATFTLANSPTPPASLMLFKNGSLCIAGTDFTLSYTTITFMPKAIPQTGDTLVACYRYQQ